MPGPGIPSPYAVGVGLGVPDGAGAGAKRPGQSAAASGYPTNAMTSITVWATALGSTP